jgi:anti-sigma regulatory factor (Ser/Thr protein kinase)
LKQPSTISQAGFWPLQLAGWLAFAVAMTFSRIGIYPLGYMIADKTILTVLGIIVTLGLREVFGRVKRKDIGMIGILVLSAGSAYAASMPWTAAHNLAMEWYEARLESSAFVLTGWFQLFGGAVYHAFVLMAWSVLYFGIKHYQDLEEERERALRAEAQAHVARLEALRYQIHPHFLFNVLNAISTLVAEGRNREAGRMIARLSDFLRLTLDEEVAQEVPLAEEIDFVKHYLDIEQIRFGDRLRTRIDVEPEALSAAVPSLILQPLVENAVRHGISRREEGGEIEVAGHLVGGTLRLRVRDDGPGFGGTDEETKRRFENATERPGIGLANTSRRLEELYGENHRFSVRRADGGGIEVVIDIPFARATYRVVSSVPT